jgi:Lipopolysaccharide kinase (Kdo/WaaP) family
VVDGAGAAAPKAGGASARFVRPEPNIVVPCSYPKVEPASAFALAKSDGGLDIPMGWGLAAFSYLPPGRIRKEIASALHEAAGGSKEYLTSASQMHFIDCLPLRRSLMKIDEPIIQRSWDKDVKRWWPDAADGSSENTRLKVLPFPQLIGRSCEVDFIRIAHVGKLRFGLAVGELKNSDLVPLDGAPEAIVAAISAACHMRKQGLAVQDCVVPFFMSNGQLEQHGAVYLLEPCLPCAVLTSPVLDVTDNEGRKRVRSARWACRRIAENTHKLLKALTGASAVAGAGVEAEAALGYDAAVETSKYLIKEPLPFVGPTTSHSVLHQLTVFKTLLDHDAARDVIVPPAAALMQHIVPSESGFRWEKKNSIAFPRLEGFKTGVPRVGEPFRKEVLAALKTALQAVHAAGVVHMDLYPDNVLWRKAAADEVEVRLVDFDAALFIGQAVPDGATGILEHNGHTHTYHPRFFDWWHFALLQWRDKEDETACPFVSVCSSDTEMAEAATKQLKVWRNDESAVAAVLKTVQELVAEERLALGLVEGECQAVVESLSSMKL